MARSGRIVGSILVVIMAVCVSVAWSAGGASPVGSVGSIEAEVVFANTDTNKEGLEHGFVDMHSRNGTVARSSAFHGNGKNPLAGVWRVFSSDAQNALNIERIKEENDWKNSLVLSWMLPEDASNPVTSLVSSSRFLSSWIRNWFMATTLYFIVGGLWAYYCYYCFGDSLYPSPDHIPSMSAMLAQMRVAFTAMPLYAMLPAATEQMVEAGWTLSYARIDDVGIFRFILYFALYMTSVEFCVYWQHRNLHDFRTGYKYLHKYHHIYNKDNTLSPFAGLAFHPLDGILQAVPYTWTLFYIPQHFMTHELLLFLTAIWTTSIHDCIHVRMDPIMGAGYHKLHHLKYTVNHGHYFWYMDRIFGTLLFPEDYEEEKRIRLEGKEKVAPR